jgi:hypothetical protein
MEAFDQIHQGGWQLQRLSQEVQLEKSEKNIPKRHLQEIKRCSRLNTVLVGNFWSSSKFWSVMDSKYL